ncbi:MAG: hypothetical protein J7K72_01325 [Candidatus Aenigmarchaeota archaeon]|nr:hypothetical protein [Candidatus Aenigmarchaeota archaeon]
MKLSNEVKISLIAVICILVLTIISKNILHVQLDFISQYGPLWVYIVYIISRDKTRQSKICSNPLSWSLAIIFVTLAILALYAA